MKATRIACSAGALLIMVALSGCGSDNPSGPSLSSAPSAPTNLRFEGSLLTWDPSPDADVVGYEIEADRPDAGVIFVRVNPRTNSISAYDVSTDRMDYDNTWYRVRAVDADGNRSLFSNSVYVTGNVQSAGGSLGGSGTEDLQVVNEHPLNP